MQVQRDYGIVLERTSLGTANQKVFSPLVQYPFEARPSGAFARLKKMMRPNAPN